MRTLTKVFLIAISTCLLLPAETNAGKIEAIKGKEYFLTKKNGPWMVMVAVFSEPPEDMKAEGIGPEEAAQSLVYELRTKGIPAYTFWRKQSFETINTIDRRSKKVQREYELDAEICVLAGNYGSPEEKKQLAKRTLEWTKKYKPECLQEDGIYKPTPGQPGPLSGAFLTINPMLSPEEVKKRQQDPELIKYNSRYEYSLLNNPGKYTVVVASFYGNSVTQVAGRASRNSKNLNTGTGLENAADQSWQVMRALREREMEAYVFHDRKKSIVTIGGFNSKDDPRIRQIIKVFGAQWKKNSAGKPTLVGENMVLPSKNGQWMCTFDPQPKVIEVPFKK